VTNDVFRYVLSAEGHEIDLLDGEATLGRSRTSTVRLEHESVSRSHALLTLNHGEAIVKDLKSSNGTYVGGKRISHETRLQSGDRVQLGAAVIDLRIVPPSVPSDRTALLAADALPPQPPAAALRPPSGITFDPVPGVTNPGAVVPASLERAAAFRERRAPALNEGPRNAANPFARLLAALVDAVILTAISLLLFAPVFLIDYFRTELQTRDAAPDWAFRGVTALSILLAALANALYVVGGWAWRGRTPGKSLLGLTVVKRGEIGGRGIGWKAALIRAVVLVLAGLPLGLGWVWAFFDKEKRAFHDLAAGTWVVRSR
jgi:uncharacterized RDD family membrane protein YckC